MADYTIHQGSALDILQAMPAETVQCVITSPPYYGLRSYGTEPQVWGNHNGCSHVWGSDLASPQRIRHGFGDKPICKIQGSNVLHPSQGNFCQHCDAWRGELGLEPTFHMYIEHLIEIFAEVKRVLRSDGTCFVNLGDSYASSWPCNRRSVVGQGSLDNGKREVRPERLSGLREKSLMNIPGRFAIAMTDELQFIQRNEKIWHKPACMPSSAKDRWTVDFEPIFFFAKEPKYKFNQQFEPLAVTNAQRATDHYNTAERYGADNGGNGGLDLLAARMRSGEVENRNARTVRTVPFEPSADEHYAAYPTKLIEPMLLAGTDAGDVVLDPFNGTATTGLVALRNRRRYLGIELNPEYIAISEKRLKDVQVRLF